MPLEPLEEESFGSGFSALRRRGQGQRNLHKMSHCKFEREFRLLLLPGPLAAPCLALSRRRPSPLSRILLFGCLCQAAHGCHSALRALVLEGRNDSIWCLHQGSMTFIAEKQPGRSGRVDQKEQQLLLPPLWGISLLDQDVGALCPIMQASQPKDSFMGFLGHAAASLHVLQHHGYCIDPTPSLMQGVTKVVQWV